MANDTRVYDALMKRVVRADKAHVRVGVLASKGGGAPHPDAGISMVELAAVHEFGAPGAGIPERSFIRRTFTEKRKEANKLITQLAKAVMGPQKMPISQALNTLGSWGAAEVKNTIAKGPHIPPPLQAETVARKGSTRPLVNDGHLLNSIQWEVRLK